MQYMELLLEAANSPKLQQNEHIQLINCTGGALSHVVLQCKKSSGNTVEEVSENHSMLLRTDSVKSLVPHIRQIFNCYFIVNIIFLLFDQFHCIAAIAV